MFETFQLSSDAFYYLKDREEPIIDDAIDEALVIEAMFPDGFTILDYRDIGNTGYIEAHIGPKLNVTVKPTKRAPIQQVSKTNYGFNTAAVEVNSKEYFDTDEAFLLSKVCRVEIVWSNQEHSKLRAYVHLLDTGQRKILGDFDIQSTPKGLKYFQRNLPNGTFTRLYLKHFNRV